MVVGVGRWVGLGLGKDGWLGSVGRLVFDGACSN